MLVGGSDDVASPNQSAADNQDSIDIFISYAREDQQAAIRLSQLLEAAGWTVWWDRRISTGKAWRFEIDKALQNARCVIALWSRNSIHSQWVHEEAEEARQAGKLMPVLIEHVRPPPGFREVQTANLTGWDQSPSDPGFRQLNLDIGAVLSAPLMPKVKAAEIRTLETAVPEVQSKSNRRKIVMALLATIVVFATGTVIISLAWNWHVALEQTEPAPTLAPSGPVEPDNPASESSPGLTQGPLQDLSEHKGDQAVPKGPTLEKPESPSGIGARCAAILHRLQLGEVPSDQDRSYLQKECAQ